MSLVNQALVVILKHLLIDAQTWAGNEIYDQPVDPLGHVLRAANPSMPNEPQRPVVAVYVESSKFDVEGRATQGRMNAADLKVCVFVAPGITKTTDSLMAEIELDTTAAGLTLNFMARQIDAAFHREGPWFTILNKFVQSYSSRDVRYVLYETEKGISVPAMEIAYKASTLPDPSFGAPMMAAWVLLDTELRKTGQGTILADLIKAAIESPTGLPEYRVFQTNYGLTAGGLFARGNGPILPDAVVQTGPDAGEIPELVQVTQNIEVQIVGPGEAIDGPDPSG